jgi:hypothetical protein
MRKSQLIQKPTRSYSISTKALMFTSKNISLSAKRNVERTQVRVQYDHSKSFYCIYTNGLWAPGRQNSYYLYPAIRHDGHATLKNAHYELVTEWSLASRSAHSRRTASGNRYYRCTLTVFLISATRSRNLVKQCNVMDTFPSPSHEWGTSRKNLNQK